MPLHFIREFYVSLAGYCYVFTVMSAITFLASSYWFFEAGAAHFKSLLTEMDQLALQKDRKSMLRIKQNTVDLVKLYMELLR